MGGVRMRATKRERALPCAIGLSGAHQR
ncbi:MAG: hypothetical protein JWN04_5173, partial [Myxococcaceae bacterium]|nr:hypothetical protein [Myxococcaceae bacterium]